MEPRASLDLYADLQQVLQYHFMQNAVKAGTLVAILGGLMGYFMVLRGQSFAGHTLSQVGFPGAAGAALIGVPPLAGLLAFCTLAALGIGVLSDSRSVERRTESAAVGTVLASALALGFLFASLYHGFVSATYAYLFGSFIGIGDGQVLVLALVVAIAIVCLAVIGRPLLFASLEPDVAAARRVPVRLLSIAFLLLLGLAVAACSLITGTLLVFALLVAPAAAAQHLTTRPGVGIAIAVMIALAVTWIGIGTAYFFNTYPIGFFVTTLAFIAFLLARATRWARPLLLRRAREAA